MGVVVEVKNLKKSFDDLDILKGVTFKVKSGTSCSIMGASGGGKSVLLQSICGLMNYDSGDIFIDSKSSSNSMTDFLKKHKIGYLFQHSSLIDYMTALENVAFYYIYSLRMKRGDALKVAREYLDMVHIDKRYYNLYPSDLSGGTQKRIGLARALSMNIDILLLDEPDSGLDPISTFKINNLINELRKSCNITVISITHDFNTAKQIGDEIHFLDNGKILWSGKSGEMLKVKNEKLQEFLKASGAL